MYKNKILLITFAALFVSQPARALDLPQVVADYLKTQYLLDMADEPLPHCDDSHPGSGNTFVEYTLSNWSAMLDNLSRIAPEARQQELIVRAIEFLPGRPYLDAVNKLCDLKSKGIISNEMLEFAIAEKVPKFGFLSNNYQDPQVAKLVQRLQHVLPKNDTKQSLLSDILSGKQKDIDKDSAGVAGLPPPTSLSP